MIEEITDVQSEASIIATIIRHPQFINNVSYLKPNYFYHIENGCLYWVIEELVKSGIENIDALNMTTIINKEESIRKTLQKHNITDIQKFIDLSEYAARETLEEYKVLVDRIVTLSYKREMVRTAKEIEKICYDNAYKLGDLTTNIDDKMLILSNKYIVGGNTILFGEKIDQIWDEICSERNSDGTYGIPSKIEAFHDYFSFSPGELIVLSARMKMGKSIIFTAEAIHKAVYNNIPTLYIDTEISDKLWTKRVISSISGVEFKKVEKGTYNAEEAEKIGKAIERIKQAPLVHEYMPGGYDFAKIEALCKYWKNKMDLKFVIYDYMKCDDTGSASEISNKLGRMCDDLKNKIAGRLELAVFSGAQLNRANEVASSDKIDMYCSTRIEWRKKTAEEVQKDGLECGNFCAAIPINRNGEQTDEDEYLDMMLDSPRMRVKSAKQHKQTQSNPFISEEEESYAKI